MAVELQRPSPREREVAMALGGLIAVLIILALFFSMLSSPPRDEESSVDSTQLG
jgi:hypothetical protein